MRIDGAEEDSLPMFSSVEQLLRAGAASFF